MQTGRQTDPIFVDGSDARVPTGLHLRRQMAQSQMFLVRQGLDVYRARHPHSATFDVSQGDGGASLGGISPEELAHTLRLLPKHQTTRYGKPEGELRVREVILGNYHGLGADQGFDPGHVVSVDGGRDGLQKWYQAISIITGVAGDVIIVSAAPWQSYAQGSYISGFNLLRAPRVGERFGITIQGIEACVEFAEAHGRRVRGLILTSPDNPTGTFTEEAILMQLIERASELGVEYILLDLMYQLVIDSTVDGYDLKRIISGLSPQARKKVTVLDGLTKSAGASNVRHAHLVCADKSLARMIKGIASHTVLPNVLGQMAALEVYGYHDPRQHPWITRVVKPTTRSRQIFRAMMRCRGHEFIADQGYYAFVKVAPWLNGSTNPSAELARRLTSEGGIAVIPGHVFHQPEYIRFSLANAPEYTAAAVERLHETLSA